MQWHFLQFQTCIRQWKNRKTLVRRRLRTIGTVEQPVEFHLPCEALPKFAALSIFVIGTQDGANSGADQIQVQAKVVVLFHIA